jgi:predicted flavoprotein YhiN
MEQKFAAAWAANRAKAETLGIKMRPVADADALKTARRTLSGNRLSDGFNQLLAKNALNLSLEALVIDKRFTALFTDEECNEALQRLLEAGYRF